MSTHTLPFYTSVNTFQALCWTKVNNKCVCVCGQCVWSVLQTFLVRKCASSQRKVLCLRVTADKSVSSVKECFICEEDSSEYKTKGGLANSAIQPPDAHYTLLLTVWSAVQFTHSPAQVLRDRDCGVTALPVNGPHSCQSNSVSSITSLCLGELGTHFPRLVSSGGLLLYQQVSSHFSPLAKRFQTS